MKILVSACLLGENCKYSGGNNYNQAVCDFARGHQVVPVCPEVLGGLPTPRCPAEIVQGVVTNKEGINVDREFRAGAAKALAIAKRKWGGACHPAIPQSQLWREGNLRWNVFRDKDSRTGRFCQDADGRRCPCSGCRGIA